MDWTNTTLGFWGMGTWLIILILFMFMWNWGGFFWNGFWWGNNAAWLLNGMNNNNNHDNTVDLINNNIEKAILAGQQNTASIIASSQANVQKVLDKLCEQETDRLRSELEQARLQAANSLQSQYLISQIRPYPIPSWEVSSPYTSINTSTTTS